MSRAFVVTVSADRAELAADVLWQLGVRAIEERTVPSGAPDAGDVELWTSVGDEPDAIDGAVRVLGGRFAHRVVEVDDAAAETWREFAAPMRITDHVVVVPAWQAFTPRTDDLVVRIEPGDAFGLGDHPTTALSLQVLVELLDDSVRREVALDILDVGCGTGVLAIAAAVLQRQPVRAIDVSAAAVEATIRNARRNGVADLVTADRSPLAGIADRGDSYDVVVANILAPTLVALADDLRAVTRAGGRLVVSGILAGSHDHVLSALAPMVAERTVTSDGWACVVLAHPR